MCAYNKKWHVKAPLYDFDAVSLYPSAMAELSIPLGRPKVIPKDFLLNYSKLNEIADAYVVEIQIYKVYNHYPFPLIVQKTLNGNLNDDNIDENHPVTMVVDNITLEDLIEYQGIEFTIIKGYYWNEGVDKNINKVIQNLSNKRKEYKATNNHLQNLYKLIMNSCYGKTIEKPIKHDWIYKQSENESNKYIYNNYFRIVEHFQIEDSNIFAFKVLRPIDKHFNFSILGIQVLSMSKRIMNRVMCLGIDNT